MGRLRKSLPPDRRRADESLCSWLVHPRISRGRCRNDARARGNQNDNAARFGVDERLVAETMSAFRFGALACATLRTGGVS